jgi:hypothetical protein
VLDAMARLAPGGDRDLAELLSLPECRRRDRGLRVVVTTDIGLRRLNWSCQFPVVSSQQDRSPTGDRQLATQKLGLEEGQRRAGDRFVVLKAGAFGFVKGDGPTVSWPVVPWIWIDGPGHVATCLRRAGKEVGLGR